MHLRIKACVLSVLIALPVMACTALAQSLSLLGTDTSAYPVMRALVYAFDASGNPIRPSAGEFKLSENGADVRILRMDCPPAPDPAAISSVLTIDVSGSMAAGRVPNIELARAAARVWVDGLPDDNFECALTSFDDKAYLQRDFSRTKENLYNALAQLRPNGGTNYEKGFGDLNFGALPIAGRGQFRRVVVFLTDGLGDVDAAAVISAARAADVTVYVVTLGMPAPPALKTIAEKTGGLWFQNITTTAQAVSAYKCALASATGAKPCTIEWQARPSCLETTTLVLGFDTMKIATAYQTPVAGLSGVSVRFANDRAMAWRQSPLVIDTWNAESNVYYSWGHAPGGQYWRDLIVKARGFPVRINSVESSAPSVIYADPARLPISLAPGQADTLRVWLKPKDSSYIFARLLLRQDGCPDVQILARGGFRDKPSTTRTLKLLTPNGGEVFASGSKALVRYEGISPDDPVRIEISTNKGSTWQTVAPSVKGLEQYVQLPRAESDRCLARVTQIPGDESNAIGSVGINSMSLGLTSISTVKLDTSGVYMLVCGLKSSTDGALARVYNMNDGGSVEFRGGYYAMIMPDNRRVFSNSASFIYMHDLRTGKALWHNNVDGIKLTRKVESTADGSKIMLADPGDGPALIISASNGAVAQRFPRTSSQLFDATISPDGARLALAEKDSSIHLFDAASGRQIAQMTRPGSPDFYSLCYSPDGSLLLTTSSNQQADVWDGVTGRYLYRLTGNSHWKMPLLARRPGAFMPDGRRIVAVSDSGDAAAYDAATGAELFRFRQPKRSAGAPVQQLYSVTCSPDGSLVALESQKSILFFDAYSGQYRTSVEKSKDEVSFSADGAHFAYVAEQNVPTRSGLDVPLTVQSDVSDNVWAIVDAHISVTSPVVFPPQLYGTVRDSIVQGILVNNGRVPVTVTEVAVETRTGDFRVVGAAVPVTVAPGASYAIELSFSPRSASKRSGQMRIRTSAGTMNVALAGTGFLPSAAVETKPFNLGTVDIGGSIKDTLRSVITNTGEKPVTIRSVQQGGPDTVQFEVSMPTAPFTLRPGQSGDIPVTFRGLHPGRAMGTVTFNVGEGESLTATVLAQVNGREGPAGERYTDPTTFRSIAVPNAIIPKRGSIVLGVYDVIGLMAGYAVTDNVMVLAGGGLPTPDDWGGLKGTMFGAYSAGVKGGFSPADKLNIAAGYQYGHSLYKKDQTTRVFESNIDVHALYGAVSYGTDDSRVSLDLGYALKHHTTTDSPGFSAGAYIVTLGGDIRIGNRWKLAAEVMSMRTLGYIPVLATVRYFGHTWAIDAGLGYVGFTNEGATAPDLPVAPVLSVVWRW